jgi:tryptophan 2,3-dioxygenase
MRGANYNRDETFSRWREQMIEETQRFIEWGLQHPDKVEWIPRHRVGQGGFSERVKNVFWMLIASNEEMPD